MIEEDILQIQSFSFLRELQINVELQDMHTTNSNVVLLLNEAEKEPMNNQDTEISYQTSVDEVRTSDEQMSKKFWRFSIRDLILWYYQKVHVAQKVCFVKNTSKQKVITHFSGLFGHMYVYH